MDSEPKEVKQDIAINMEAEDQAVDVAQVAPAIQAEGSALAGGSTQENPHPPTLEEITADPIGYRRYVSFLATQTPPAPPHLSKGDIQKWQDSHLLTATLDHLKEVLGGKNKFQKAVHSFYEAHLVVNLSDYKDSRFYSVKSEKSLFVQESTLRSWCRKMVAEEDGQQEEEGDDEMEEGDDEMGEGDRKAEVA